MLEKSILSYLYHSITALAFICSSISSPHDISVELPLVIAICGYDSAPWVQRNLDSIFNQDYKNFRVIYIDDASQDNTVELVTNYIKTHNLQDKITLIANPRRVRKMKNIYTTFHTCADEEIIIQVDADDWLPHNNIFKRINETYAAGNVWLTYSDFYTYPEGTKEWNNPQPVPNSVIEKRNFRYWKWVYTHMRTFYAWLFKQIKLEDLMSESTNEFKGKFFPLANDVASFFPMLEMCGSKFAYLPEKLYVYNRGNPNLGAKVEKHLYKPTEADIRQRPKYPVLKEPILETIATHDTTIADTIIFSSNNNTAALITAINTVIGNLSDIARITVIHPYNYKFKTIEQRYPTIRFIPVQNQSIKESIQTIVKSSSQNYFILTHDNIYVQEPINISACIMALCKTKAHAFYLGFAHNQLPFTDHKENTELVPHQHIWGDIYAWKFAVGQTALFNNIDMTLIHKNNLLQRIDTLPNVPSIELFFKSWHENLNIQDHQIGLFYENPKLKGSPTINFLPLEKRKRMRKNIFKRLIGLKNQSAFP